MKIMMMTEVICCSQSSSCYAAAFDNSEGVASQMNSVEIEKKHRLQNHNNGELMKRMIQLMDLHMPRSEMMTKSTKRR